MNRFWSLIPDSLKMTAAAVVGIFAIVSYLTMFQTDAEAMETEKRIYQKLDKTRIEVNEQKIKDYEFKLLEPDLTEQQKEWIDRQIKSLNKKIDCIRDGKC
jgi:hypothetical protein